MLNGYQIHAGVAEQVEIILDVAAGKTSRNEFTHWLQEHIETMT